MLADEGIGEWGFVALAEIDGRPLLIDTGARPRTVLENSRELELDLGKVHEVVLTHFHDDHTGGLVTLRSELSGADPAALATAHVARGIFYSRPRPDGREANGMLAIRTQYQAAGGVPLSSTPA